MELSIEVKELSFFYEKNRPVWEKIHFKIKDGSLVSLLGPNGAGKSTLFQCMLGLQKKYKGEIRIDGENIRSLSPAQMARKAAYIPQSASAAFNYTVKEIVLMGTTSLAPGMFRTPGKKEEKLVKQVLEKMKIGHLENRSFMNLSGGERQLVLIARALAQQAKILFMDEPAANLDYGNQILVLEEMRRLAAEGYTVIQSTHNPEQAFLYSDSVMAVKEGKIIGFGPPEKILSSSLIKKLYGVDVKVESLCGDRIRICVPSGLYDGQWCLKEKGEENGKLGA